MSLVDVIEQLMHLRWGGATDWSARNVELVREFYRRLLPWWPERIQQLQPDHPALGSAVLDSLPIEDRARIVRAGDEIVAAAGRRLEFTTRHLVPLVLAWTLAVERGQLAPDEDPAQPLLELFRSGFQLRFMEMNAGLEIWYRTGCRAIRLPPRSEFDGSPQP